MDATAGGTQLTLADDAQATVALPFSFRYYGQPFSSVTVSSNGFLVFGPSPATAWINSPLPNTAVPNGVVAAYWDDLNPALGGGIWYRTLGTPPTASSSSAGSASATPTPPAQSASRPCSKRTATRSCSPTRTPCTETQPTTTAPPPPSDSNRPTARSAASSSTTSRSSPPIQATTSTPLHEPGRRAAAAARLTPPAVPTGLQATAGDRQVALDWADNTDPVASYRVYRNGSPVASAHEQRLHRHRPHERQHVHLPGHRARPGGQRKRPLQPGQRQPTGAGHPTRRNDLSPPAGTVHLGGCDRRRHAASP